MNYFSPILAQEIAIGMSDEAKRQAIYVGIFVVLILGVLAWAAFIRKSKQKRKRLTRPHGWEMEPGAGKSKHKRSHRRRSSGQSSSLKANPTRADKGGLPPLRPEDVPPTGA